MKVERQLGILSILLQKQTVTAPYLSERFEVCRRTIHRDIEDLCSAGIPIVTKQGVHGGISVMDSFKLDKTLLTPREMQDILIGLGGLNSISGTNHYGQLMEKLAVGSSDFMAASPSVLIDLSSWYKSSLAPKIELIRLAIEQRRALEFQYYSPKGESLRCVEPYYLVFHWSSWYVWGWCRKREDFRLFKLNRMEQLRPLNEVFERRTDAAPDLEDERVFTGGIRVTALFEPACKWRLIEEYGPGCFQEQPDGRLLFREEYTGRENLIAWILAFGEQAELLEPEEIRAELRRRIALMKNKYEETPE